MANLLPVQVRSDPGLLVLHGLRLKGFADPSAVAEAVDIDPDEVPRQLDELADRGLVEHRATRPAGWALTPAGRTRHATMLADELARSEAGPVVRQVYGDLVEVNPAVLDACARWQVRRVGERDVLNDHADVAYDAGVISDLAELHLRAVPLCERLAEALCRFAPYRRRLGEALSRVQAGQGEYFTKPGLPSYHTVWFELHEDLLLTLGIDRASEGGS